MAVINELGRNSAAITYPNNSGSEQWPTFASIDKWLRNDTLQGTGTASGTTVTGANTSIFNTQVRAGDTIMIAGQLRIVQSVASDTSFTVTQAFSPAITTQSSIRLISYTCLGTANNTTTGTGYYNFSNIINGTVSVTADANGTTVNGVGTYFLSDLTNSVVETTALAGTVAVDTSGNITGTNTTFNTGVDGSTNRLQPGDSVRIGASNYFIIATVTSDTAATVTQAPGSAITAGASVYKATNGVAGRTIVIGGRPRVITSIVSNTQLIVNAAFDFFDSNLKVKSYPRGTIAITAVNTVTLTSSQVTNANLLWDLPTSSQVWIGDELRTLTVTGALTANLSSPLSYSGTVFDGRIQQTAVGVQFRKDDTLIAYVPQVGTSVSQELRVGDDLIINGTECTVTQIISDTLFRVGQDMPTIPALSTVYKKKKMHGYVLEGTREGATSTGKYTSQTYVTATATIGATSITVNSASVTNNFVKISNAGGPPVMLSGSITTATTTALTGTNTKFTTELHVGAEICVGGMYAIVATITNDTTGTIVNAWGAALATATPIFRTVPLYTYLYNVSGNIYTLATPLKNNIGVSAVAASSVIISSPSNSSGQAEFVEFVYSAPNKSAEASVALTNQSLDRKYFGVRWYPMQSTGSLTTSNAAYNLVVYERWVASFNQTHGVGINKANGSDGTTALSGVTDMTTASMTSGGFLYLFAKPRYFIIQGKTFSNTPKAWLGCIEFERAQPEDVGTGLGTSAAGVSYFGSISPTGTPNISPWPCFAYFHSDRFPVGSGQVPTQPIDYANSPISATFNSGIHGGIYACPRIHASSGDIVGISAHVYSACTITTGRWGHIFETGGSGSYVTPATAMTGGVMTATVATIPVPHLGHLVPVNSNVYNSKRFMFSPVVVMGPAYDPDIRGRIFGLKVIPSALGALMDTVSVTVDTVNDFYDSTAPATDHWVITSPGPSGTGVTTYRFNVASAASAPVAAGQYRSLEDAGVVAAGANPASFLNNFRFAIPA